MSQKLEKVLITGATGYVADQMLAFMKEQYETVLVDTRELNRRGEPVEGVNIVDLIDPDRDKYSHLFEAVDAVIHLAYKRRSGDPLDHFNDEKQNVEMAYNVFRSSYDAGVQRVVMASSNHAADWYEHALIHNGNLDIVRPYDLPLSDNFYGWAKAAYELLAWPYACGIFGRKLETVMLRIGFTRPIQVTDYLSDSPMTEQTSNGIAEFKRNLGAYISPRDITQLFSRAIEAPDIENEHGIPFVIAYGCSDNTRRFWSLETGRKYLDYQPQDDTEIIYANEIRELLTGDGTNIRGGKVGI